MNTIFRLAGVIALLALSGCNSPTSEQHQTAMIVVGYSLDHTYQRTELRQGTSLQDFIEDFVYKKNEHPWYVRIKRKDENGSYTFSQFYLRGSEAPKTETLQAFELQNDDFIIFGDSIP